jgi:hypothetical protein
VFEQVGLFLCLVALLQFIEQLDEAAQYVVALGLR